MWIGNDFIIVEIIWKNIDIIYTNFNMSLVELPNSKLPVSATGADQVAAPVFATGADQEAQAQAQAYMNVDTASLPSEDKSKVEEWITELRKKPDWWRNWYDKGTSNLNNNFRNHIRGRLLFILAEQNLKEKSKNIIKGLPGIGLDKPDTDVQRGIKYREALNQLLTLSDKGLGDYSVLANTRVGQGISYLNNTRKNVSSFISNGIGNIGASMIMGINNKKENMENLGKGGKHKKRRTKNKRRK